MRIKNWDKFQQYKDGRPVLWIKLYHSLLDDYRWNTMDGESSRLLINLWLLASERGGTLPEVAEIAFRLRLSVKEVEKRLTDLSGWLEDSPYETVRNSTDQYRREEKRREEKRRVEKEGVCLPFDDPEFIQLWNTLRVQPKWKNKTTASLQQSLNKLERWGLASAKQAMEDAIAGNWQGLFEPKTKPETNGHTLRPVPIEPETELYRRL